jgi:hypothetical protein
LFRLIGGSFSKATAEFGVMQGSLLGGCQSNCQQRDCGGEVSWRIWVCESRNLRFTLLRIVTHALDCPLQLLLSIDIWVYHRALGFALLHETREDVLFDAFSYHVHRYITSVLFNNDHNDSVIERSDHPKDFVQATRRGLLSSS